MPTIQGRIIQATEPRTGQNERGSWMAQDFILESYDQPYPRKCVFSVWGADRLQQFNIKEGDDLAVDIDLDVREYQGRYYNSVRAWRVTRIVAPQPTPAPSGMAPLPPVAPAPSPAAAPATPAPPQPSADPLASDPTEDLPF